MMLELIRNDPEYQDGNYTTQPRSLKLASVFFGIATAGGTLNYQKLAPTNEKADQVVDARLAAPMNRMLTTLSGHGILPPTMMPLPD